MTEILAVSTTDRNEHAVVIAAKGELDRDSRQLLDAAAGKALDQGRDRIVLDLAEVTFCDSSALSLLVALHRTAAETGGSLRVAGAQGIVRTALTVMNLDRLLTLDATVEDSLRHLGCGQPVTENRLVTKSLPPADEVIS